MATTLDNIIDQLHQLSNEDFGEVANAMEQIRRDRARQTFRMIGASLDAGDEVRLRILPGILNKRYLDGAECIAVETRTTKITCRFPDDMPFEHDPYNKYAGTQVILPAVAVEIVSN
jgi:hypothetical protein